MNTKSDRLMRQPEVLLVCSFQVTTLKTLISNGTFPAPKKIPGTTINCWLESVVQEWVKQVGTQERAVSS